MTLRGSRLLCGLPCGLLCGLLSGLLRGLLSGLLLLVAGCYDAPVPAPHGRVVLDMVGRQVQLPAEIKRVAAVRDKAPRGKKKSAEENLLTRLGEAGAITERKLQSLGVRKATPKLGGSK